MSTPIAKTLVALAFVACHVGASQVISAVPLEYTAVGLLSEHKYQLRVTQSVDSNYVTHISTFVLVVGEQTFTMPMEQLRRLDSPAIQEVIIRSYREPLTNDEAVLGDGTIVIGGHPRVSVGVPFGRRWCEDGSSNLVLAEGAFVMVFDESGTLRNIDQSTAQEDANRRGLTCDAE